MSLLAYRNLTVSFGGPLLLNNVGLTIEKRERVCLIGRNGEGKSTLLRILSGQIKPDQGELETIPKLRIGKLDQEVPAEIGGTVFEVVAQGLGTAAETISEYHRLANQYAEDPNETLAEALDALQEQLTQNDGWALEHKVEGILNKVELDGTASFSSLSGGNKRRALLARALTAEPHILLLDEPTNHLDIPGIRWLEEFLRKADIALLFVSHDRAFIKKVANRIIDLDRGELTSWRCDYSTYLERKAELLAGEAKQQAVFDKKLAEEEVWIRKGIQARRTRNEGRVRALQKMRRERAQRRNIIGTSNLNLNDSKLSGRKVLTVEDITYAWDNKPLIQNFSTVIWRGDKIGIVGLNGSGKSTLLNLLLEKIKPQSGSITCGTKLEIAYFDQHRAQLDTTLTVAENVHPYGEMVTVNGKQRHILTYLQDFLFTPEVARAPITKLSGGERARLLLARLFLQPANVLVLDEPTNDLDIETVELLEERLLDYEGTLLLVSHDRSFLNNVVTNTIALEGNGTVTEYNGGCEDWIEQFEAKKAAREQALKKATQERSAQAKAAQNAESTAPPKKLSQKEREQLKALPAQIEQLEADQSTLCEQMAAPDYYQNPTNDTQADSKKLESLEAQILQAYETWETLSEKTQ